MFIWIVSQKEYMYCGSHWSALSIFTETIDDEKSTGNIHASSCYSNQLTQDTIASDVQHNILYTQIFGNFSDSNS